MLTKDSIYVILFSIPVYQILFYTVQLVSFRRKNPSKKYLGLLLLSMTIFLVLNAIHFLGYHEAFTHLYIIYLPLLLSVAPSYFLYIVSITHENHDVNKRQRLILFSPAILMLLVNLVVLLQLDHSAKVSMLREGIAPEGPGAGEPSGIILGLWILGTLLVFAQIAFAIVKVYKIITLETELMRRQPRHLAYLEWPWILAISAGVMIFLVINALLEMIVPIKHLGLAIVYNLLMLISGGIAGYFGMKQDTVLNEVEKIGMTAEEPEFSKITDLHNGPQDVVPPVTGIIPADEAEEIHKRILDYLSREKPYLKTDFSMHDLCARMNLSRRKVSYVLNEVINKNFYGVINEFRVREAEELLLNDSLNQMKIEALGEMVGFQSKSSFNACFKKVTGMTPSEYRVHMKSGNGSA